ncbi:MAG: hypothetical protein IIX29_08250 [Bacteroidales bacterium]|nr:hypothetical protein [Bacteroidales bacterium]
MKNETFDKSNCDPLFDKVVEYARGQKRLTASGISDKFYVGFNRANRIIRQIEESGVLTTEEQPADICERPYRSTDPTTKVATQLKYNESFDWDSRDPLFDEVVEYARGQIRLTASGISHKFYVGFNRANRIIRQIEESGVLTSKENDNERTQD